MFENISGGEILIIALVLLFLFGGKKLPELARGLGESGKELKKAKKEIDDALHDITTDDEEKKPPSPKKSQSKGGDTN